MGVSAAARALEALISTNQSSPASSSAGSFSTGQGLPTGSAQGANPQGANAQTAPSNASNRFASATLGFLTALQDPESAAAGFVHGAETAIGQDVSGVGSALEKLKNALTGPSPSSASVAASALSVGSTVAGALNQLPSELTGLFGGHHHHRHGGVGAPGGVATSSSAVSVLSLTGGAPTAAG
ncbi:MAG TPA: hypothetical protein VN694_09495 [Caulobacteraceae bacterium]|nr:hypothetical protein [Caulobacteraceae bacterium]